MALRSLLALVLLLALPTAAAAAKAPTRYSLVHGCYALGSANGPGLSGGEQVRMQAPALGRYLLYTPDQKFLAAQDDGSVSASGQPSPAADWEVKPPGAAGLPPDPNCRAGTTPD